LFSFSKLAAGAAAAGLLIGSSAYAGVLYDNGPLDGNDLGWTINFGFAVSDSFTLSAPATVTGVTFGAWNFPGDVISTVDWGITSAAGTYPDDGTAAVTTGTQNPNSGGYLVSIDSFSTGAVSLAAGTYYLVLQNAGVSSGDPAYWDQNSGPSSATENTIGDIPSETFQILGTSGTVPEPTAWALMLVGFAGLGAALRGARKVVAA
jgi:hypothetical protein